jgi:hypothetical protein
LIEKPASAGFFMGWFYFGWLCTDRGWHERSSRDCL